MKVKNSKAPKVAFFGTSNRSTPILESINGNFELVLVVTKNDRVVGRKKELVPTEVKVWSKDNDVTLYTLDGLDTPQCANLIEQIVNSNAEVGVVCDFSFIIPEQIINTFQHKIINIHFSMLPKYRGASPVQHALLNGDKETGVSFYIMDKGMDTGHILAQFPYSINENIDSEQLYSELFVLAAKKLPEVLEKYISEEITPKPQKENEATYCFSRSHPKSTLIFKEDAEIDWSKSDWSIHNSIRAFAGWPFAWSTIGGISEAMNLELKDKEKKNLKVKVFESKYENGSLKILKVQVEGKNITTWKDFLNGYFQQ